MTTLDARLRILGAMVPCDAATRSEWALRIGGGRLTRDDNAESHFCVYFLPYDPSRQAVLLGHHKKADSWIAPGGHIDAGELPEETLLREIAEEMGITVTLPELSPPFLLTQTLIDKPGQPCRVHFEVWYVFETMRRDFTLDADEFYDAEWLGMDAARARVTDPSNLAALNAMAGRWRTGP